MLNKFFNIGLKTTRRASIKAGTRLFSAYRPSTKINSSPSSGSGAFLSESVRFEDENHENNEDVYGNSVPYLKYAILAGLLAVGSKVDEFGYCLFNFGPKVNSKHFQKFKKNIKFNPSIEKQGRKKSLQYRIPSQQPDRGQKIHR